MIEVNKVAAVKLRQKLEAIEPTEPIKPPSFAAEKNGDLPRYIIYESKDGRKDAVLDNAPSQANRIEPLFVGSELIPEVTVDVGSKTVSITELGHRSCDAAVRFSTGAEEITNALKAYVAGNAEPLAKLAPLDILFGSWDSRPGGSGAKLTRLIRSVIRATDVSAPIEKLGQYRTSVSKEPFNEFSDKQLSGQGILDCPVSGTSDGVLVLGELYRSAELNVRGIRRLRGESLQNYILGLGLFALTAPAALNLREGCNLVAVETKTELVNENGTRTEFNLTHDDALAFARKAAKAFGVGQARHFAYNPKLAIEALQGKKETGKKKSIAAAS
jgi:CRISPR-associated protein Csb1